MHDQEPARMLAWLNSELTKLDDERQKIEQRRQAYLEAQRSIEQVIRMSGLEIPLVAALAEEVSVSETVAPPVITPPLTEQGRARRFERVSKSARRLTPKKRFQDVIPEVLRTAGRPMHASEILERLQEQGFESRAQSPEGVIDVLAKRARDDDGAQIDYVSPRVWQWVGPGSESSTDQSSLESSGDTMTEHEVQAVQHGYNWDQLSEQLAELPSGDASRRLDTPYLANCWR